MVTKSKMRILGFFDSLYGIVKWNEGSAECTLFGICYTFLPEIGTTTSGGCSNYLTYFNYFDLLTI